MALIATHVARSMAKVMVAALAEGIAKKTNGIRGEGKDSKHGK